MERIVPARTQRGSARAAGDVDVVGHRITDRGEALTVVVAGVRREDQLAGVVHRLEDADALLLELGHACGAAELEDVIGVVVSVEAAALERIEIWSVVSHRPPGSGRATRAHRIWMPPSAGGPEHRK